MERQGQARYGQVRPGQARQGMDMTTIELISYVVVIATIWLLVGILIGAFL